MALRDEGAVLYRGGKDAVFLSEVKCQVEGTNIGSRLRAYDDKDLEECI